MQHPSDNNRRAVAEERRKRARDAHMIWKACMFPARPPPPFLSPPLPREVGDEQRSEWLASDQSDMFDWYEAQSAEVLREASFPYVQAIRRQMAESDDVRVAPVKDTTTSSCATAHHHACVRDESTLSLSSVEARLAPQLEHYQPLADTKRTLKPEATLVVFRLPKPATEEDLLQFGEKFGRVLSVRVVRHPETGVSRCYGFIQFRYPQECDRVLMDIDRGIVRPKILGRVVVCQKERARTDPNHVPARLRQTRDKLAAIQSASNAAPSGADGDRAREGGGVVGGDDPPRSLADNVLDNLDDYLAAFS